MKTDHWRLQKAKSSLFCGRCIMYIRCGQNVEFWNFKTGGAYKNRLALEGYWKATMAILASVQCVLEQRIVCAQSGRKIFPNDNSVLTSMWSVISAHSRFSSCCLVAPLTVPSRSKCQQLSNPRYLALWEAAGGTLIMNAGSALQDGSWFAIKNLFRPYHIRELYPENGA